MRKFHAAAIAFLCLSAPLAQGKAVFHSPRQQAVEAANARLFGQPDQQKAKAEDGTYNPDYIYENLDTYGDLDGPDGKLWYYTASFDIEYIHHEYWNEPVMHGYSFNIYDSDMQFVGDVKAKIEYEPQEVRCVLVDLAPVISRHFFNEDDQYEVVIAVTNNTTYYVNRTHTNVYSLGNEKVDGYDVPVMKLRSGVADVVNASTDDEENFIISFLGRGDIVAHESRAEDDDNDNEGIDTSYWDRLTSQTTSISAYSKARPGSEGPVKIFEKQISSLKMPGDQQDIPFMISFVHDGVPYLSISYYKDFFYNPYYSYLDDMTQRDGNSLIVELWRLNAEASGFDLVQTTEIPAPHNTDNEACIASYYSVGNLRYRGDFNFDDFNTPDGQAALYITRQDYVASSDRYVSSYYLYMPDGTLRGTIFENAESTLPLSDLPGCNSQQMFVSTDPYSGSYLFDFIDLKECKTDFKMKQTIDYGDGSDPDKLTANIDRVALADRYAYACELRVPGVDDEDNNFMRVAWFDSKGQFDRIEEINMGKRVNYAQLYMASETLDPEYFHSGPEHEYMMLIKRSISGGAKANEELLVAQPVSADNPHGRTLLLLGPDERYGALSTIVPYFDEGAERLMVGYAKDDGPHTLFAQHFYDLPLDQAESGTIDTIVEDAALSFDGKTLMANSCCISVYNLQGIQLAAGQSAVDLSDVPAGVYIVKAGDARRVKIVKR